MIEKIKKLADNYWHYFIIAALAIIFFIGVSSFNYYSQKGDFLKWLSPDETANYTFAKLYAQSGQLTIYEKYNPEAREIIHPRSFRSDYGSLKPVSFLGIILIYGKIGSFLGYKAIPYLTPFFASIGIIFFYLFIRQIFGKTNALISAFLLASFPVYIYYSARSMFHNVLFVDLLIIGLYFGALMTHKVYIKEAKLLNGRNLAALAYSALAGFFLGLSLITRTSELLWIGPMLIILWLFNVKKIGFVKLIVFLAFLLLSFTPVFYWNHILYGSIWMGGYPEMNKSLITISAVSTDLMKTTAAGKLSYGKELLKKLKDTIFYFGFSPRQSFKMLYYYFAKIFYWLFWPSVLGFLLFLTRIKKWRMKYLAYILSYLTISLILLFYYGSWGFHDNPDLKSFTIGNSYTRYWLPIYMGALPFVSIFIMALTKLFKKNYLILSGRAIIIILIFFVSIKFVLAGSDEGLINSYKKQREAKKEMKLVLSATEKNSVIITQYHDKLFFPERKVIVGLFNDDNMNLEYAKLASFLPVYYYNFTFPEKDFNYLNKSKLHAAGLGITEVKKDGAFSLYKLSK